MIKKLFQRKPQPSKIRFEDLQEPQAYIASYPKCGRTWLRLLIGRYLCLHANIDTRLALETQFISPKAGVLTTQFTHDGTEAKDGKWKPIVTDKTSYAGKKVILLMRDPRDVAVSCYFQATKREKAYEGSVSDYIRDGEQGIRHYLDFLESWEGNTHVPDAFLLLRYRDIMADPARCLRDVLAFIGCKEVNEAYVQDAVEFSQFSNMRKMEETDYFASKKLKPGDANEPESYKVRRGKVGGYLDYLSQEDCNYLDDIINQSQCTLLDSYRTKLSGAGGAFTG
jgi:hypothetical protein